MKVSKRSWEHLVKKLNGQLKNKIDFIPIQKPWHFILRVCRKRKIDTAQERAMIKLCERISQKGIQDGCPRKTVAACAFWKICQHSIKYRSQFKLIDICKKSALLKESLPNEADKYFDTTPDTIKKFFSDKMEKEFYHQYLPDWPGRINVDAFIK